MLGWPWNSKNEQLIELLTKDNKEYKEIIEKQKEKIMGLNTFIDISKEEVEKAKSVAETITSLKDIIQDYIVKSTNNAKTNSKSIDEMEKENRYLKANIKSLQNRLKTFTAGIENRQTFEVIQELRSKIDKFLQDEDQLFVTNVKDKLVKADFFDKFATTNSITLNKDLKYVCEIIKDISKAYSEKDGQLFLDVNTRLAQELYSRAMYKPFVKRSVAMNNKTKELLTEILDTILILDDSITNNIIELKLENKRLRDALLEITSKDDKAKTIHDLQQEIARLKVENEALRYMK